MSIELPDQGFVFWPVGNGDSTTIAVDVSTVIQVDLHHTEKSDDENEDAVHIVDELVEILPQKNGNPYLSVFALTHPDKDHIQGFEELLEEVTIGEIWHTPRVFLEFQKDLCEDAKAFKKEVERRKELAIKNPDSIEAGNRVRVFGHDDIFKEAEYEEFPEEYKSYPGNTLTVIDGKDYTDVFETFIHAPFKDGNEGERNETSLALQISLISGSSVGKALLLGDLSYPTLRRIYDKTLERENDQYLEWNVLLSPHHCSKKAMYWKVEEDRDEELKSDIMSDFEESALDGSYIIASSESKFTDGKGDNPPHQKARIQYEKIIEGGHFICTHEYISKDNIKPVVFEVSGQGFAMKGEKPKTTASAKKLSVGIATARGSTETPKKEQGFG